MLIAGLRTSEAQLSRASSISLLILQDHRIKKVLHGQLLGKLLWAHPSSLFSPLFCFSVDLNFQGLYLPSLLFLVHERYTNWQQNIIAPTIKTWFNTSLTKSLPTQFKVMSTWQTHLAQAERAKIPNQLWHYQFIVVYRKTHRWKRLISSNKAIWQICLFQTSGKNSSSLSRFTTFLSPKRLFRSAVGPRSCNFSCHEAHQRESRTVLPLSSARPTAIETSLPHHYESVLYTQQELRVLPFWPCFPRDPPYRPPP